MVEQRWLRMGEASEYSGLSPFILRRLHREGRISGGPTEGGHMRFDKLSIDAYFNRMDERAKLIMNSLAKRK